MYERRATHAGSWYSDSVSELNKQLNSWLSEAQEAHSPARAIIAPHAGYRHCGACAAYAYRQISSECVKRVFILGPSHFVRLSGCALTKSHMYQTPLGKLPIDMQVTERLHMTGEFEYMHPSTDEREHSIEMHLPYIAKVMEGNEHQFTIIPILVGSLTQEKEACYGKILARYLADPENLFIVSSDFCHWGQRFHYTYFDKSCKHIHQSIENLDKMGMDIIEKLDPNEFSDYLKQYGNTICGRHPIGVLLQTVQELLLKDNSVRASFKFLNYAQSTKCINANDSSVSYAAGALLIDNISP